jgi:rod shape determining protein RodA
MIEPLRIKAFWRDFDWPLFGAALLLCAISLTEIYSSTMHLGADAYALKQLMWVCVGIVCMFIVASVDYHTISEHIPWLYLSALGVLIYVPLAARRIAGAKSWLELGPFSIQPSEIVKMVVVVALARYLAELHVNRYVSLSQVVKAGLICAVPMGLILLQPDMGTALSYVPILAVGLFLRGVRPMVLVVLALIVVLVVPMSWYVLKDHQKDRILTFLYPDRDPQGSGYQVNQSRIAIGSGGFFGKGLFNGTQNQLGFLPTTHTDFIFSVVGEEMGFAGVVLTLGLLGFILFRSIYNAQTARDHLGLFIILGVVSIYFFHTFINVAMVIGFWPVIGIPLPFMSYGGSSVLTAFIGLGLVISVRSRRYVN